MRAVGSASSRSGSIGSPVTSSTPYVPSSSRCSAASISARSTSSRFEDREVLLALEHLRRLVGRVLVVVRQVAGLRGLLFVETLAAQLRDQLSDPRALALEPLASRVLVHVIGHARQGTHPRRVVTRRAHSSEIEARAQLDDALVEQPASRSSRVAASSAASSRCASSGPIGATRGRLVRRRGPDRRRAPAARAMRGSMRRARARSPRASASTTRSRASRVGRGRRADRRTRRPRRADTGRRRASARPRTRRMPTVASA